MWKGGLKSGQAIYTFADDGARVEGTWKNDKRWDTTRFCKSCGNYKEEDGKCDICGAGGIT